MERKADYKMEIIPFGLVSKIKGVFRFMTRGKPYRDHLIRIENEPYSVREWGIKSLPVNPYINRAITDFEQNCRNYRMDTEKRLKRASLVIRLK